MKAIYSVIILSFVAAIISFSICCFYGYFYPMKYVSEIKTNADVYHVDAGLIASVINVESGYQANAKSSKGAIGLMQLMPTTAEWLCDLMHISYEIESLETPEYNIKLGSYYLSYLQNQFGDIRNAICAYNAGPSSVRAWLKDKTYSSDGKTLSQIPFPETAQYVNKVYKNYHYYKNKYK